MLKVGFITSSLSSEDGWGRYSKSLTEEVSRFAEVRVLTHSSANNHTFLKNVSPVLPDFAFSLSAQAKTLFNAMKYLRGCDVIHSLVEPFAPGAAMASKLLGAKFIMTLHCTYAVPPKELSVRRGLMKFAYRRASITTTGSKYTEAKVRESINRDFHFASRIRAFIHQHASPHARFLQRTLFRSQLPSGGAALDWKPTGAPAFRVFLRHRSTRVPCLRRFVALRPRVSLPALAAPRSSAACRRTVAGSDALPPAGASSTAHASPAGPRFSLAAAGDSSATSA